MHYIPYIYIYIYISAVKRLIVINRIQNKSFSLYNICVCTVYIYYLYINTHTCMYIFQKNMLCLYTALQKFGNTPGKVWFWTISA